jgi:hypothetical protein
MNTHDEDDTKQLLRRALPPLRDAEPARDLWPAVLRRLSARPAPSPPWFDWALAGGLVVFAAFAPSTVPVLLYYL